METEGKLRLVGLASRITALILAIILLGLSAATIGIIQGNDPLIEKLNNVDNDDDDEELELLGVVANTLNTATWLIFLAICVSIGEKVAIILLARKVQTGRLVLDILEIIFSFIVAFLYFSTGIACAIYAAAWSGPPEECTIDEDIDCMEDALVATNALQAVVCFVQIGVFCFIGSLVIYTIVQRKNAAAK